MEKIVQIGQQYTLKYLFTNKKIIIYNKFYNKIQNEYSSNDFIVYSKNAGEVAWLKSTSRSIIWDDGKLREKKYIYIFSFRFRNVSKFWIYILIYCLSMLLILGFLHYFVVLKHFFPKAKENDPLVRISRFLNN